MTNTLKVNLDKDSYDIIIDNQILNNAGQIIASNLNIGKKILIISDQNVYPLYGDSLKKVPGKRRLSGSEPYYRTWRKK